jgi:TP901 family phage tail tape measure protein
MQEALAIRPLAAFSSQASIAAQRMTILSAMFKQGTTNLINFGKNVQWAGRQLMVGFTVPLTIFGTAATKVFRDLEKEVVNFKKVYGDLFTTDLEVETNLNAVKELSKEFTKYGIAAKETMMLAAIGAQAGKEGAELQAATVQATRLSVLGDIDRQTAMKTTIALQSAFKLSNEELANSINFLNLVENSSVVSLQNLTDAIPRVAPVIVGLGGDIKDMAVFLAAMQEGGVNAAEAANGLKSSLGRLISPTKQAKEMADGFGISLEQIVSRNEGNVLGMVIALSKSMEQLTDLQKQQLLSAVFGKFQFARMGALFENITREGSQASRIIEMMDTSIEDLAATADKELGAIENSLGTQLTAAIEKFKLELAPIGELFAKMAIPIINFVTKILESFNSISDSRKTMLAWVGMIVGIAVPALTMFFGLIMNLIGNMAKFGQLLLGFAVNFARKGPLGAIRSLTQSTKYLSLAEIDAANAARQLGSATEITNAALLKQVSAATPATAAINALTASYRLLAAEQARAVATQPALFFAGRGIAAGKSLPIVKRNKGGEIFTLNQGNRVPGVGNTDTVPAMLTPGEFVVNKESTQNNLDILKAINSGTPMNLGGQMKGGILHAMAGAVARSFGAKRVSNFISAETGPFANKSRNTIRRPQSSRTASKHNVPPGQIIGKKDNFVYGFEPLTNQQLKGTAIYKEAGFDRMGVPAAQIKKEMLSKDGMFFIDSYAGGPWNQAGYTKAISNKIDAIVANNPGKEIRFLDKKGLGRVLNNPGLKTDPRYKDIKFLSVADIHDKNVLSYLKPDHLTKLRKVETQTQMLARGRSREFTAGTPMFESIDMLPSTYPAGTTVRVGDQVSGAHLYQYTGEKWTRLRQLKARPTDVSTGPDSYHRWSKGIKNWRGEKRPEGIHASHVFNAGGMVPIQKLRGGGLLRAFFSTRGGFPSGDARTKINEQFIKDSIALGINPGRGLNLSAPHTKTKGKSFIDGMSIERGHVSPGLSEKVKGFSDPNTTFHPGLMIFQKRGSNRGLNKKEGMSGEQLLTDFKAIENAGLHPASLMISALRNSGVKINQTVINQVKKSYDDMMTSLQKDSRKNFKNSEFLSMTDDIFKTNLSDDLYNKLASIGTVRSSKGGSIGTAIRTPSGLEKFNKGGAVPGGMVNPERSFYGYVSRIVAEKFSQGLYHAGNIKGPLAAKGRGTRGPGLYTTESQQAATMFKDRLNQPNLYKLGFSDDQIKMIQEGKVRTYDHSNPIHRRKLAEELGFKAESKNPNDVYFTKKGVPDVNDINLFNSIESGALKKLGYDVGMFPLGYSRPQKGSYVTSSKSETYTGVRRKRKDYFKVNSMPEQQYYDQTRSWTNKFETGSNEIIFVTDKVVPSKVAPKTQSIRLNKGNIVPGVGNTDTVPAMLTPGEFVINKESTKQNYDLLTAINNGMNMGGKVQKYNNGGEVRNGILYANNGVYLDEKTGRYRDAKGRFVAAPKGSQVSPKMGGMGGMAGMTVGMGLMFAPMIADPMKEASSSFVQSIGQFVSKFAGVIMGVGILATMLPGIITSMKLALGAFALPALGAAAALAAVTLVFVKTRSDIDKLAKNSAQLGASFNGAANALDTMANILGKQTPLQSLINKQVRFTEEQIQAQEESFAALQSESGQKFVEKIQSLSSDKRVDELISYLQYSIAAGLMDQNSAKEFARVIGVTIGDTLLAPSVIREISSQKTGSTALLDLARKRSEGFKDVEQQPLSLDLARGTEAAGRIRGQASGATRVNKELTADVSFNIGKAIQVYKDAAQTQALAYDELDRGVITQEKYNEILQETIALQKNAKNILAQSSNISGVDAGATKQAIKDQMILGGMDEKVFKKVEEYTEKISEQVKSMGLDELGADQFEAQVLLAISSNELNPEDIPLLLETLQGEDGESRFNLIFNGEVTGDELVKLMLLEWSSNNLEGKNKIEFDLLVDADPNKAKEVQQILAGNLGTAVGDSYQKALGTAVNKRSGRRGQEGVVINEEKFNKINKAFKDLQDLPDVLDKEFILRTATEDGNVDPDLLNEKIKEISEAYDELSSSDPKVVKLAQIKIAEFYGGDAKTIDEVIKKLDNFNKMKVEDKTAVIRIETEIDEIGLQIAALSAALQDPNISMSNAVQISNQIAALVAKRGALSTTQAKINSGYGGTNDGPNDEGGSKPKSLFQRLKEEEKLAKDFVKSMGRLASITGVGSLGFIEKIVGEGEEGLKLLKSGGKKLKAAFDAYRNTIIQGVKFELNVSVPRQIKELNELEKTRTDLINQGLIPAAAKELDMEYLLFLSREKNSKEIKKYIKNLNDLYNAKNRKTGDEALLETLNSQNSALNYQVDLQERRLRSSQNQITEIQEQNEEYSHQIDLYNKGLEKIAEEEEKINEQYNLRIEALNKVQKANERAANLSKQQVDLASALASGDIAAAAKISQDITATRAQNRLEDARGALEEQRQKRIESLTISVNGQLLTRKQIENEIKTINDKIWENNLNIYDIRKSMKPVENEILRLQREQLAVQDAIADAQERQRVAAQNTASGGATGGGTSGGGSTSGGTTAPSSSKFKNLLLNPNLTYGGSGSEQAQIAKYMGMSNFATATSSTMVPVYEKLSNTKKINSYKMAEEAVKKAGTQTLTKYMYGGVAYRGSRQAPPSLKMAYGSIVPGIGLGDKVPALLTPGEFVVRKSAAQAYMPLLESINSDVFPRVNFNGAMPKGSANNNSSMYNNYSVNVNVSGTNASPDDIANAVMEKIKRIESRNIRSAKYLG